MVKIRLPLLLAVTLTAVVSVVTPAFAATAMLTVDAGHTTTAVGPYQFGHIIEDINHSMEGGLLANVVRNGTMKEGTANPPSSWSLVTAGGGTGSIAADTAGPLNAANQRSLRLTVTGSGPGQRVGAANGGFYGIGVRPSTTYQVAFWARATAGFTGPLTVTIESTGGAVHATSSVSGLGTGWQKFTTTLTTGPGAPVSTANRFVIAANGAGAGQSVWLDVVQAIGPTFQATGSLRRDLEQLMADTRPGFFRVPGGNYLEGAVIANRFAWKNTIGPVEQRPGHQNDAWGYWSTDQFGLLNYLQMAEQAGAEPMLGVFAGYTLNGSVTPQGEMQQYVQEALDEIEYVTGGTNTTWGARRAADGHPAPFPLRYVEIGNEDWFDRTDSYNAYRYPMLYDAIKARYPQLQIIATRAVTSRPMDVIDDHYYNNDPDAFAALATRYDGADRNGPKVLVGEYGVTNGSSTNPTGTLSGALAEAAFMTGLVRNADLVMGAAYAPALTSVDDWQWSSNLIGFNAVSSYGSPSYYVQKMFGTTVGDHVVPTTLSGGSGLTHVATRTTGGAVAVTVVNRSGSTVDTQVNVTGAASVGGTATVTTLTGDPNGRNSITSPTAIVPVTTTRGAGPSFTHTFPANSVTVIQLSTTGGATPVLPVGQGVSLRVTTPGYTDRTLRHQSNLAVTSVIAAGSSAADKLDASFVLRPGLAGAACYSLEARDFPGQYLRHQAFRVKLAADDGSALFAADATFCAADGNGGPGVSLRSYNFPTRFLRHYNSEVWIAANGGTAAYDSATNWAADTTWRIGTPWFRSDVSVAGGFHSLRATTPGFTDRYVRHQSNLGVLSQISASSPVLDREDATFDVVPGLADNTCYSFESRNFPGRYLRHNDYRVKLAASDGSAVFNADATFCAKAGVRFQSYNFPDMYLRHYNSELSIASNGGARPSDNPANYVADTTWVVTAPLG
ncbi:AbfB domain-containing protein [Dactylosporangium sp. NPDC006015]|uniref:AbfB domain-containing protein n=1 Tax=Dactylosporangium sp. NPDC006015 TaxID=3154576 RepID=UPI0033B67016